MGLTQADCSHSTPPLRPTDDEGVHYNSERNHQSIGNELTAGQASFEQGLVECSDRLGGLLKHYHRAA
jgi:hypothetical protein